MLAAVVAGYDVMAALLGPVWGWGPEVSRPPNSVLGPFGAAAVAARLFGLTSDQTARAFGHAGQSCMGLFEGGVHRWIVYPLLARNGVIAAALARAGFAAAPTIVEGTRGVYRSYFSAGAGGTEEGGLARLGDRFAILDVEMRRYPASILNHVPIDLTRRLVAAQVLTPAQVAAVDLILPEEREQRETFYGVKPGSPLFALALVLAGYDATDPLHNEQPPAPEVEALIEKMRLRFERGHPLRYARVEITTTDGDTHVAASDMVEPPPALNWGDWLGVGGRQVVGDDQLVRLAAMIRRLEDVPDVAEVMACVVPPNR